MYREPRPEPASFPELLPPRRSAVTVRARWSRWPSSRRASPRSQTSSGPSTSSGGTWRCGCRPPGRSRARSSSRRSRRSRTPDRRTTGSGSSSTSSSPTGRRCRPTRTTHASCGRRGTTSTSFAGSPASSRARSCRSQAEAHQAWVNARQASDFAAFQPWLERVLDLRRRWIECFAPYEDPYDVVLDDFEEGMRTSDVREIFAVLAPEISALVAEHATDEDDEFMAGPFPIPAQDELSRELIERVRGGLGPVPAGPRGPSVRGHARGGRHTPHDPLRGVGPHLAVDGDARMRPRAVRVGCEPGPRADAQRGRVLGRAARVPEPALGERRRPLAAVLALVLPTRAEHVRGRARRRVARPSSIGRSTAPAGATSASTPTR